MNSLVGSFAFSCGAELSRSFIWKVTHPFSDRTQPCLTLVKLMELAGLFGHSHSCIGGYIDQRTAI